jgi:hypothetical protein
MPTFNTPPASPLVFSSVNNSLAGTTSPGSSYRGLEALDAGNVEDETLTQRLINMRSCVQVFGPISAVYPRDWKASVFADEDVALPIPGASLSFDLEENCTPQVMFQLSWQALISPPPENGSTVMQLADEPQRAKLWLYVDGEKEIWSTSHRLPYVVAREQWFSRGKAAPFDVVGPAGNVHDVDPARQRTVSGFYSLGQLQAGRHHVALAIWYSGQGIVRVRSSQMAVIARYR